MPPPCVLASRGTPQPFGSLRCSSVARPPARTRLRPFLARARSGRSRRRSARVLEAASRAATGPAAGRAGMGEDEVVGSAEARAAVLGVELGHQAVGHRHGPRRAPRLGRAELAADVVAPDADAAGEPVDVALAQRQQLALAQPGHRRRQVQRVLGRTPLVVEVDGPQQRLLDENAVDAPPTEPRLLTAPVGPDEERSRSVRAPRHDVHPVSREIGRARASPPAEIDARQPRDPPPTTQKASMLGLFEGERGDSHPDRLDHKSYDLVEVGAGTGLTEWLGRARLVPSGWVDAPVDALPSWLSLPLLVSMKGGGLSMALVLAAVARGPRAGCWCGAVLMSLSPCRRRGCGEIGAARPAVHVKKEPSGG
jgi:hypothetical protein